MNDNNKNILKAYDDIINNQLQKGIVERNMYNKKILQKNTKYIPHHTVTKPADGYVEERESTVKPSFENIVLSLHYSLFNLHDRCQKHIQGSKTVSKCGPRIGESKN